MFRLLNPNRLLVRGFLTVIIGGVIVFVPDLTLKVVMQILGFLLIFDGVLAWLINYYGKNKQQLLLVPKGSASLFFGTMLVVFPTLLVNIFVFMIGLLLILAGASQFANQIGGRSRFGFSWLLSLISLLAFAAGAVMITRPFESMELMLTMVGVVVSLYGVGEIILGFKIKSFEKKEAEKNVPDIQDVDYEEIDD